MSASWPRQGGNAQPRGVFLDPRTNRYVIIIDDRKPRNTRPASETFLRDKAVAQFGKRTVRKAMEKLLQPKHPVLKVLDAAEIGYDIWKYTKQGGDPVTLPRDPSNREDMAIDFPPEWTISVTPESWFSGAYARKYHTGPTRFLDDIYNVLDRQANGEQVIEDWITNEIAVERTAEDFITYIGPQRDFWIGNEFDNSADYVGDTRGVTAEVLARSPHFGPAPQWLNDPRTVPGTETEEGIRVIPAQGVSPRRAWRDLPRQPRHRFSESGPQPVRFITDGVRSPGIYPDFNIGPVIGTNPNAAVEPPFVVRRPPGPRVKERKVRIKNKIVLAVIAGIELVPEALDAINALWKALPKSCQSGYYKLHKKGGATFYKRRFRASQKQRISDLYKCWTHMDMQKALEALVANQIEDSMYGLVGKIGAKAGNEAGLGRGVQFGSWDTFANDIEQMRGEDMASFFPDFDKLVKFATRSVIPTAVKFGARQMD